MPCAKRTIALVCLILPAAGCRDSVQPAGPHAYPDGPVASAIAAASTLVFSTFVGGADDDDARAIAVDRNGFAYVVGETLSPNFPATAGAFRTTGAGLNDVVVAKLDPSGSALVYATYLGGTADDAGAGIAVDAAGNAYVTGRTASSDFPTTAGVLQPTPLGPMGGTRVVGFVTKLSPGGSALAYSTYLGGSTTDEGGAIGVDALGRAYVTGVTSSADFPTTAGAVQPALGGLTDAFVTALNPSGSAPVYSTYLGGAATETGSGIAVDGAGQAYVTGRTGSTNFPTTPGAFQTTKATATTIHAAFVTKLNPSGSALVYSTYLAGTGGDRGTAIALDGAAPPNVYVAGRTSSPDFPTTLRAFQGTFAGLRDGFVTKLNSTGSVLVYSTYLGGAGEDEIAGVTVDGSGSVSVVGTTTSIDFPVTVGAVQPTSAGLTDAFFTNLDAAGSTLLHSTYLGGTGDDEAVGIGLDGTGSVYLAGTTESVDFPTTAGAVDPSFNGPVDDMFVVKFGASAAPATLTRARR